MARHLSPVQEAQTLANGSRLCDSLSGLRMCGIKKMMVEKILKFSTFSTLFFRRKKPGLKRLKISTLFQLFFLVDIDPQADSSA